ncbi:hypothetical protein NL676_022293 [Syzygium grande]|nr:hypothetical protein NL676_022293 [Syzygium grande]
MPRSPHVPNPVSVSHQAKVRRSNVLPVKSLLKEMTSTIREGGGTGYRQGPGAARGAAPPPPGPPNLTGSPSGVGFPYGSLGPAFAGQPLSTASWYWWHR